ncbi:hypothetical protein [Streptomyces sp. NPDC056169]|uniref:hypothetical protein n=1 Tax=Streptomyces sp. NPDC056169 TaxID=3345734 RepID=UPI0035DB553A
MLLLIHAAEGVDTRALARGTRMPMNTAVRLLDWLRDEQLIDTGEGAHFPGALTAMAATQADPDNSLLKGRQRHRQLSSLPRRVFPSSATPTTQRPGRGRLLRRPPDQPVDELNEHPLAGLPT